MPHCCGSEFVMLYSTHIARIRPQSRIICEVCSIMCLKAPSTADMHGLHTFTRYNPYNTLLTMQGRLVHVQKHVHA